MPSEFSTPDRSLHRVDAGALRVGGWCPVWDLIPDSGDSCSALSPLPLSVLMLFDAYSKFNTWGAMKSCREAYVYMCICLVFWVFNKEKRKLVTQSCPTLCDPMDCSLPGSHVCGILQTGILEWAAVSFTRRSSRLRERTQVSCTAGRFFTN